ncbi:MAG TPA: hypothetical protein VMF31_02295 [Solirubrobacterales bacterium]|nr:hypothetical protein [Solirubrobacterales bacterium]
MGREWKEVPDETEEIVLEDTQEYRVADPGDEFDDEFEDELEDGYEQDEEFDEDEGEFEEEAEFDDEELEEPEEDLEDGYYEDEDFYEEEPEEPEGGAGAGKSSTREPLSARVKAVWAALVVQARGVEPPSMPRVERKLAGGVAAILLACLAVGIGAYALGKGSGDDVDVARIEGEAAGRQAGAIEGATRGYAAGFVKGRDAGFAKTYEDAYRRSFKRAFEQAGLEVPSDKDIDVPEP